MKCPPFSKIQQWVMRIVNASPVILLGIIFAWSFWAYNVHLCLGLFQEGHSIQASFYIFLYHVIFIMCIWSYWTVCRTSPGYTIELKHEEDRIGLLTSSDKPPDHHLMLPITVKRDGNRRFCQKCRLEKYDRTHHCRLCKRCVLKMDHHCPWINNCVGFHNHKAFYLFLVYATLYCLVLFATTLPALIGQLSNVITVEMTTLIHWVVLVFLSGIFGIFLVPFSLFHTRQLCKNRTTIEYYEKANYRLGRRDVMRSKYFNPWDIGTRKNVEQVLGKGPWWTKMIPIQYDQEQQALGNGTCFPINTYAYETLGVNDVDDDDAP
ncbi:MAG: DHHC palmitoyltransferase-domain-containing protein [Benjaminiella poitrasii]|nr:MAG: DHHC palmitoyltransferase-domain-containing protein [Benjaminiella poitrasii]